MKVARERIEKNTRIPGANVLVAASHTHSGGPAVSCLGTDYPIYAKGDEDESWGRATFALFDIVNRQLAKTPYRFFAINGGNDLGGLFLTPPQAEAAKKSLPRKQDWPYLPSANKPWYGRYH